MSNLNKILLTVFFILLIVTGVEIFYFFVFSTKSIEKPSSKNILITRIPTKVEDQSKKVVSKEFLDYLLTREKVDGYKLYFEEEKAGVISSLNFDKYTKNNISFVGFFVVSNDKGEKVQGFAMTKGRLNTMKFYKIKNGEKILFDFFNLKLNQKIKYVYKTDLTASYDPKINPDGDVITSEFIVE